MESAVDIPEDGLGEIPAGQPDRLVVDDSQRASDPVANAFAEELEKIERWPMRLPMFLHTLCFLWLVATGMLRTVQSLQQEQQ